MGEIHRGVSVSFRQGLAFVRGNLHRPYGFGRNGTVFGVAPPHNVEALARRRSPKSGTVCTPKSSTALSGGGSLRGRRDRSEKVENRGQIFSTLRQIVVSI